MKAINPKTLAQPRGYNNGLLFESGSLLFIAGQIGWNRDQKMAEGLVAQFDQSLFNILEIVSAAGGSAGSIARFTIYVKDKRDYVARRKEIGVVYRKRMGKHYPAMSLVIVKDLLEDGALVEIEATAVIW